MDAFYASVEQRDNPELKGRPIVVGGSKERGVVAAASYEARKFGVKSAMPSVTAKRLCPSLIFIYPRFDAYKSVSTEIREIFHRYTDLIEPLSLDEAYLDVTENKIGLPSATLIAQSIKAAIADELNLVASAGVSYNKFLAKIASDEDKPNGLFVITPAKAEAFIDKLPIRKFFGVGKVTAEKMNAYGIFFGKDLKRYSLEQLTNWFGKSGGYFYNIARGIDERSVNANRIRKSIGVERTFESDVTDRLKLKEIATDLSKMAFDRCARSNKFGKSLTLKIKFNDFTQITRSKTNLTTVTTLQEIEALALTLLEHEQKLKPIRLMGVTLSNFPEGNETIQLTLEF
jgi:DNA polymerase-4